MANSILKMRSAFTQAGFNERMAKIVSYEIAYAAIAVGIVLAYFFSWEWFFAGIILIPILFSLGISVPFISDSILIIFAVLWAIPFMFIGFLGVPIFFVAAFVAFIISIWVHAKAFTFYADLSRWD